MNDKLSQLKDSFKLSISNNTKLYETIKYIYNSLFHHDRLMRTISYGNLNKDKTLFLVRPNTTDNIPGLLALTCQSLFWIDYAYKNNYIPVVDYKNYSTQYTNNNNAWELFYKQPSNILLDDVYKSNKVILSGVSKKVRFNEDILSGKIFSDSKLLNESISIINKYLIINDEILNKVNELVNKYNINDSIGVFIRGTDYTKLQPKGEYIQPSIDELINKIDEYLNKYNKRNIYLVTEDYRYYEVLKNKYKDLLVVVYEDNLVKNYSGNTYLSKTLDGDNTLRGKEYLIKILLLSKCKYLVSSITKGSIVAYCLNNNKYEDYYIFNNGVYK